MISDPVRNLFPAAGQETRAPGSGGEALDAPGVVGLTDVAQAIVETIGPALPEFDFVVAQDVPAPIWRQGNVFSRVFRFQFAQAIFEKSSVGNDFALS